MEGKSGLEVMGLNLDFYRGRRVLITGHTGFKGSWLSIWLNHLGAITCGIALDPASERDLFRLAGLNERMSDYRADIRDQVAVERIFREFKPETVFHLAAQSIVFEGYREPALTFETNLMGTVNILEACRRSESVGEAIIVTTDKVYENIGQARGYMEADPLGGWDPYSASKACAEIATQAYRRSFFSSEGDRHRSIAVSTARAGNVIGGGDWAKDRLIPDCVRSLERNEPVFIRNPDSVRPWQHVLESLSGYLQLGVRCAEDPSRYAGAWNFGPESNNAVSVRNLVSEFIDFWGAGKVEVSESGAGFHEASILLLDASRAKSQLGWKQVLTLSESLRLTVEWYKSYLNRDTHDLCLEQIEYYNKLWNSGSLR